MNTSRARSVGRAGLVCALTVAVSVAAMPGMVRAAPTDGEVDAINAQAIDKFKAKEYDEAAALFERAYDLSPEPNYLFNIGRIFEEKGDLERSVEFYERFVKEPAVPLEARERGLERLRVLRAIIEETAPPEEQPVEEQPVEEQPVEEQPVEEQVEEQPVEESGNVDPLHGDDDAKAGPSKLRIAGYALLGTGAAVLAGGGVVAGLAFQRSNNLEDQHTFEERETTVTQGQNMALTADILFAAGGAVAAAGLVMIIVSLKKKPQLSGPAAASRTRVSPWASRRGGGLAATVRF